MPQINDNHHKRMINDELLKPAPKKNKPNSSSNDILTTLIKKERSETSEAIESTQENSDTELPPLIEENTNQTQTMTVEPQSSSALGNDNAQVITNTNCNNHPSSREGENAGAHSPPEVMAIESTQNPGTMDVSTPSQQKSLSPETLKTLDDSAILKQQKDTMALVDFTFENHVEFGGPKYGMRAPNGVMFFAKKPFPDTKEQDYAFNSQHMGWILKPFTSS